MGSSSSRSTRGACRSLAWMDAATSGHTPGVFMCCALTCTSKLPPAEQERSTRGSINMLAAGQEYCRKSRGLWSSNPSSF
eukprot:1159491-Pelagomonas_calceolata.AAC.20